MGERTDFGFQQVPEDEKARRVAGVFDSVADRYDLMNDLMSGGLHRLWKRFAVALSGVRAGDSVLDVAAGSGDMAALFAERTGSTGRVVLTDINAPMLVRGRDRLIDSGRLLPAVQCDAERLPFAAASFDCVCVAFGLRNMTHKEAALAEMHRVLVPGGRLLVLEFSKPWAPLAPAHRFYTLQVLPWLGRLVAGDAASYRYLGESIDRHPGPEPLADMIRAAGFGRVECFKLTAGVVALHRATRQS